MPTTRIKADGKILEKPIRDLGHLNAQITFPATVQKNKKKYNRKDKSWSK